MLGDLSTCLNQYDLKTLQQAQRSAGKVLPICSPQQKELVSNTLSSIAKAGEYKPTQEVWNTANKSILKTLKAFNYDLSK